MSFSLTVNGHTYNDADYDAGTNPYGLGKGGYRILLGTTGQFLTDLLTDLSVVLQMSATDSVALGTGAKTFTPAVLRAVPIGMPMLAIADGTHLMYGTVTSKTSTQITVTMTQVFGAGTFSSWTLQPVGPHIAWSSGTGAPSGGNDGDFYIDTATGNLYTRAAGVWSIAMNILGPGGYTAAGTKTTTYTMNANEMIIADCRSAVLTINPVVSPSALTKFRIVKIGAFTLTVSGTIKGDSSGGTFTDEGQIDFTYVDGTYGWAKATAG